MLQDIEGAYTFSTPGPTGSFQGLEVTAEAPCPAPGQMGIAECRLQGLADSSATWARDSVSLSLSFFLWKMRGWVSGGYFPPREEIRY